MSAADRGLLSRAGELRTGRTPFVLATVVRAERPTSAKPGDTALLLADGTLEGFVGGTCAESTTRVEGLRMLATGESGLLRITPGGGDVPDARSGGLRTVDNPCLSAGTLEIFLESVLPAPLVGVCGDGPVARSLARVGAALEYEIAGLTGSTTVPADASAVVVASHGRDETAVLTAALRAGVPYVALVASKRRAEVVLAALDVPPELRERVRAPAGIALGARGAPEIALSIFAEFAAARAEGPDGAPGTLPVDPPEVTAPPVEARDPVCGMTVAVSPATPSVPHGGDTVHFCGSGCRDAFTDDPARYSG